MLNLQIAELLLEAGPPRQSFPSQVLAAYLERFLSLVRELVSLSVQLIGLELNPLTAGRHVSDTATDLLQKLELALVGVIEGLPRIFKFVQGLIGLGTKDQRDPLKNAGH